MAAWSPTSAHLAAREPQPAREEQQRGRQAHDLRLPAQLRSVHHREVVAWVDANDVLCLLQLALKGVHTEDTRQERTSQIRACNRFVEIW
eukprot:6629575-Pyramimonas_sp.AAC.1